MKLPAADFILAQNDNLKSQVLLFSAASSLQNCEELRRCTRDVEDSFKWLEVGSADQVFVEQFCAAIRGISVATMDLRPERSRGAGWDVEMVLVLLVRLLRGRCARIRLRASVAQP